MALLYLYSSMAADPNSEESSRSYTDPYNGDSLLLQSSDHPGMQLVSAKLDGSNCMPWRRSITIALNTTVKFGFVDSTCIKPASTAPTYLQWIH